MFLGLHILVGSSIHSVWSSLFVLAAEVMPEPKRVANGAVFNSGKEKNINTATGYSINDVTYSMQLRKIMVEKW